MIQFIKEQTALYVDYEPDGQEAAINQIKSRISLEGSCQIKYTFNIKSTDIVDFEQDTDSLRFKIGDKNDEGYYLLSKTILSINFNIFISEDCNINKSYFITKRMTSVFKIINEIGDIPEMFVGGSHSDCITEEEYIKIIKSLPTEYEHRFYDMNRVYEAFSRYFKTKKDVHSNFEKYVERKQLNPTSLNETDFDDFNLQRYKLLLEKLKDMLNNQQRYSEYNWQIEILKILPVLFPKYITVQREAHVHDFENNTDRHIDFILGDYDGNLDLIEIKKPSDEIKLLRSHLYRDNYIPSKDLSGAIMQAEKYIYFLTKNGKSAEDSINEQFDTQLPTNYKFSIISPRSIIIMGRTNNFNSFQKKDFEVIKRKYKNMIDIISYDDLIRRFETSINLLELQNQNGNSGNS